MTKIVFSWSICKLSSQHDPSSLPNNWVHYKQKYSAAAAAKSLQSCPALCDPTDGSPPSSSFPGILQARTLELGCQFLLQCTHACWVASVASYSVRPRGQQPTRLLCPQDSLGKNTGVGCHFLLQNILLHNYNYNQKINIDTLLSWNLQTSFTFPYTSFITKESTVFSCHVPWSSSVWNISSVFPWLPMTLMLLKLQVFL